MRDQRLTLLDALVRSDELAKVPRRILTLRATHTVVVNAAPPSTPSAPKMFAIPILCEDDAADARKTTRSWWLSLWHGVLCGVGGEAGGGGGIDELCVDGAVEDGMCCACDFVGPTTVDDAAPVEKEREEVSEGTAAEMTSPAHFDKPTMMRVMT